VIEIAQAGILLKLVMKGVHGLMIRAIWH
jgi:hypothetical protein